MCACFVTCTKLKATLCGAGSKAQDVPRHRADGGMPYSLPMALLQMDAEPGSLTSFSKRPGGQGPFEDADLRIPHSNSQV